MLSEALELSQHAGSRRIEAQVLHRLGDMHLQRDEPQLAVELFGQALGVVQDIGDPIGEAYVLHGLGLAHLRTGALERADAALRSALDLAGTAGERLAEVRVLLGLSELALTRSEPAQAVEQLQRALEFLRGVRAPRLEATVQAMLSEADAALGGNPDAEPPPVPSQAMATAPGAVAAHGGAYPGAELQARGSSTVGGY